MRFYFHKYRRPGRKLFFPAGWLALGLFPLLGCQLFFSDPCFKARNCVQVCFATQQLLSNPEIGFPFNTDEHIILDGPERERLQQLNAIRSEALRLRKFSGEDKVLHISMGETATWQDFIQVIDLFKKEKFNIYFIDGQEIWLRVNKRFESKTAAEIRKRWNGEINIVVPGMCQGYRCINAHAGWPLISPEADPSSPILKSNRGIAFLSASGILLLLNVVFLFRRHKLLPYSIPVSLISREG